MKKLLLLAVTSFFAVAVYAQSGSVGIVDAYSTSMGKTYTIASRGLYAVGLNPANLAFTSNRHAEIILPVPSHINLRTGTNFLSINEFNYFFGGVQDASGKTVSRHLNAADKDRMRNLFEGGGTVLFDLNLEHLGLLWTPNKKIGTFAFLVQDFINAQLTFPSDLINLALAGNPLGKEYSFNDLQLKMWYIRSYNLSYARDFSDLIPICKAFNIGVGVKLVQGFAYAGTDLIDTKLATNSDYSITEIGKLRFLTAFSPDFGVKYDFDSNKTNKSSAFSVFPSPAGSGLGFDIGLSAEINERWSFGIAITDIGKINWNTNAAEYGSNSTFTMRDLFDSTQRDSLVKNLKGTGKSVNGFTTELPTTLRIGTMWVVKPGVFVLSADINSGLNDAPRNAKNTRYSIGGSWNAAKWLPHMRGGFSFGGSELFSWTVGLGFKFGPMEFNAATPDFQYIFSPKDGKRISFAFGWRILFH